MTSSAIGEGVRRIVFLSSMARYGRGQLPFDEGQTPSPVDPYGVSKVAAEMLLRTALEERGAEILTVPDARIAAALAILGAREVTSLLLEGGAALHEIAEWIVPGGCVQLGSAFEQQ